MHTSQVGEVLRGVRAHYIRFIDGLAEKDFRAAQLGLAHAYSRSKVGICLGCVLVKVCLLLLQMVVSIQSGRQQTKSLCTNTRTQAQAKHMVIYVNVPAFFHTHVRAHASN